LFKKKRRDVGVAEKKHRVGVGGVLVLARGYGTEKVGSKKVTGGGNERNQERSQKCAGMTGSCPGGTNCEGAHVQGLIKLLQRARSCGGKKALLVRKSPAPDPR